MATYSKSGARFHTERLSAPNVRLADMTTTAQADETVARARRTDEKTRFCFICGDKALYRSRPVTGKEVGACRLHRGALPNLDK